jgi:hypothetical protein
MSAPGPDPVVPTMATLFAELRGRRVIVGVPGIGFRHDLRADNAVVQGGRTFVPVLTEQDYYRAELEQIEVFAPLVPIDRVWVEDIRPLPATSSMLALDAPQARQPIPVEGAARVLGSRIAQSVPDGYVRDVRAMSDVYGDSGGGLRIRLCNESDWYAWASTGVTPASVDVNTTGLWIE